MEDSTLRSYFIGWLTFPLVTGVVGPRFEICQRRRARMTLYRIAKIGDCGLDEKGLTARLVAHKLEKGS